MKSEGFTGEVEITVLGGGAREGDELAGEMMSGEIFPWAIGEEAKGYRTPLVGDREAEGGGNRRPVLNLIASLRLYPFSIQFIKHITISATTRSSLTSVQLNPYHGLYPNPGALYVHISTLQCLAGLFLVDEVALSLRSEIPKSVGAVGDVAHDGGDHSHVGEGEPGSSGRPSEVVMARLHHSSIFEVGRVRLDIEVRHFD